MEPYEKLVLDLPETYSGDVTKLFQLRKGTLTSYENVDLNSSEPRVRLTFEIPTRGLLGTNSVYKTATRGTGLMSYETLGYRAFQGDLSHRSVGSLVADRAGKTTAYALESLQDRGILFVGESEDVYEGMIIGEHAKENDLNVNAVRPKKLTNIRTHSSEGITMLQGVRKMTLERCIEWIDDDEWIEVTPKNIRLRKKVLAANLRSVRREERINYD
jgi:GTP-binding protein